jgi:bifunctional DNA-binding transcriptional regulator/antitoxin component of YhaV-PrlF toxin-antitoxin module
MGKNQMLSVKIKLGQGGRIIIPARILKALKIKKEDELLMSIKDEEIRIFNRQHAVTEAQTLMAKYNPKKICLSDEILEDRRREA